MHFSASSFERSSRGVKPRWHRTLPSTDCLLLDLIVAFGNVTASLRNIKIHNSFCRTLSFAKSIALRGAARYRAAPATREGPGWGTGVKSSKSSASLSIENVKYYALPLCAGRINIVRGSLHRGNKSPRPCGRMEMRFANDFRGRRVASRRNATASVARLSVLSLSYTRAGFSLLEF